jgi:hypothetical protein
MIFTVDTQRHGEVCGSLETLPSYKFGLTLQDVFSIWYDFVRRLTYKPGYPYAFSFLLLHSFIPFLSLLFFLTFSIQFFEFFLSTSPPLSSHYLFYCMLCITASILT